MNTLKSVNEVKVRRGQSRLGNLYTESRNLSSLDWSGILGNEE